MEGHAAIVRILSVALGWKAPGGFEKRRDLYFKGQLRLLYVGMEGGGNGGIVDSRVGGYC